MLVRCPIFELGETTRGLLKFSGIANTPHKVSEDGFEAQFQTSE